MNQQFNPAAVPIQYTLTFQQVNLVLEGLGKLPYDRVEALYTAVRSIALQTLHAAEQAHEATTAESLKQLPNPGPQ